MERRIERKNEMKNALLGGAFGMFTGILVGAIGLAGLMITSRGAIEVVISAHNLIYSEEKET